MELSGVNGSGSSRAICLQEELPVVLTTFIELEFLIKADHVCKDVWTPKIGNEFEIFMELNNPVDKFRRYAKTIF